MGDKRNNRMVWVKQTVTKSIKQYKMGVKKKEHRKKVEARNQRLKAEKSAMQKMFNEVMKKQVEELQKKHESESGTTENQ